MHFIIIISSLKITLTKKLYTNQKKKLAQVLNVVLIFGNNWTKFKHLSDILLAGYPSNLSSPIS